MTGQYAVAVAALALLSLLPSEHRAHPAHAADKPQAAADPKKTAAPNKEGRTSSAPILNVDKSARQESDADRRARETQEEVAKWTRRVGVFTGFLVLATLVLAIPSIWQAAIARNTARRQLRAYVGIHAAKLIDYNNIEVVARNAGQTPAYRLRLVQGGTDISSFPDHGVLILDDRRYESYSVLGPRGTITFMIKRKTKMTEEDTRKISAGGAAVYAYGRITYRDAFRKDHFTEFKLFVPPENIRDAVPIPLYSCKDGNDAD